MIVNKYNKGGGGSPFDPTQYYTKSQVDAEISGATEGLASEEYVDAAITSATQDFATEAYVDATITSATQDFVTEADITAATSPIQEQLDDVERVTASALTELHQDILDLSGATPDLSNYYTKSEVDAEITGATEGFATEAYVDDAISGITDMIGTKEEVVSRALNDLHEDILDLSGATPDLSNYYTSAQTENAITAATEDMATKTWVGQQGYAVSSAVIEDINTAIANETARTEQTYAKIGDIPSLDGYWTSAQTEDAISAATDDMKTYTDNRIDGYDSAVTLTWTTQNQPLRMNGSNVYEADEVIWSALGLPWLYTTNMQQYDLGNAPGDPNLGRPNYAKFKYVGETNNTGDWTGVFYALPANGEFIEGVPVQLTRTTVEPETVYTTPALTAGTGYYIWDNVNLTITWKRQPVIEQHIPGVVKSDGAITKVQKLTQAEYDAITTPDASTLYIITNN